MSVNKYQPHLIVLPEDDANRQIVNGFLNNLSINIQAIQILPEACGWKNVAEKFAKDHISAMRSFPKRRIALVIDFDDNLARIDYVKQYIPDDLKDRVFILGVLSEPEQLRKATQDSLEVIGKRLSSKCPDDTDQLWQHEMLRHNEEELERIAAAVNSFLFQ